MRQNNFDDGWLFYPLGPNAGQAAAGDAGTRQEEIDLPHDAMIHRARDPHTPNGRQTGFYPGGDYLYTKMWDVPADAPCHLILDFDGVAGACSIRLNGSPVAERRSPYGGFLLDVSHVLERGSTNRLEVEVHSLEQSCRWYPGAGIIRDVTLLDAGEVMIVPHTLVFLTATAQEAKAAVRVAFQARNDGMGTADLLAEVRLTDPDGRAAAVETIPLRLRSGAEVPVSLRMTVNRPHLWDVDHPDLYSLSVTLHDRMGRRDGAVLDRAAARVGIRTIGLDTVDGLQINGTTVKLRGTCLHPDNGPLGAVSLPDAEKRRCRLLKEAGFNAVRSSHQPAGRAFLDACDETGLLVIDELSDVWREGKNPHDYSSLFSRNWRDDVRTMTTKDRNHPSVILYSTGNEIPEAATAEGEEMNRRLTDFFHHCDDSRPTVAALNAVVAAGKEFPSIVRAVAARMAGSASSGPQAAPEAVSGNARPETPAGSSFGSDAANAMASVLVGPLADALATSPEIRRLTDSFASGTDIAGYNYLPGIYAASLAAHPQRLVLGTETFPADIARLWRLVRSDPRVIGDMTWTGWDYLGEAGCGIFRYDDTSVFSGKWPDRLAGIGDIDILGYRKPISYLRQSVYGLTTEPHIAVVRPRTDAKTAVRTPWMWKDVLSSWTWPGFEGRSVTVEVITGAQEVELFQDDVSLGRRRLDDSCVASFTTTYQPGMLTAVSYQDGKPVGRQTLTSAGPVTALRAGAEGCLRADGRSLVWVTVRPIDARGVWNRSVSVPVSVRIEGPAQVAGFASAAPSSGGNYCDTRCATYDGMAMAVLRSGHEPGPIVLTFSSPGLSDCRVHLSQEACEGLNRRTQVGTGAQANYKTEHN